jgi:CubicO group peptidase (beta-lactamase class C family)
MRENWASFGLSISRNVNARWALGVSARRTLLVVMVIFTLGVPTSTQTTAPQGDLNARVDKLFEKWNRTDSPGCALSVMKDGRILYEHGYGMANLDYNIAITPSTVFNVASISKQFTAASIVLLAQQRKLSLDDDVRKYIPEIPDFGATITIRNLIHHTSGLRDQWGLLALAGWRYSQDLITNDDVMSVVRRQKELNFKPGERYVYSNTDYTLLALIVKNVSGLSSAEFTTRYIFGPLGMRNTHFRENHAEVVKNSANGYTPQEDGGFLQNSINYDTVGASGLQTTVGDLALWDENFYHPIVGGPDFTSRMLQRGKINDGEQIDYAFGLFVDSYKGLPTVDHNGTDPGYRADLTRFPEQHFSAAVLCNASDTDPVGLVRKIADIYLASEEKSNGTQTINAATTTDSGSTLATRQQLSGLAGLYWKRDDDQFVNIYMKEAKLAVSLGGDNDFVLKPIGSDDFHLADVSFGDDVDVKFEPTGQGKQRRLFLSFDDGKPMIYESVQAFTPNTAGLAEYVGEYSSEEIDPVYRITLQDEKLTLARLKAKPATLDPRVRDVFSSPVGTIRFTRGSSHHISGFFLSEGGVLNFRFKSVANVHLTTPEKRPSR